jgi:hypothetical protein
MEGSNLGNTNQITDATFRTYLCILRSNPTRAAAWQQFESTGLQKKRKQQTSLEKG